MILEITKKQFCGQTMRFGNEDVKISKEGKFEVKDETLAKDIINSFDWIFEEGKIPTPQEKAKEIDPTDKETVENLYLDLEKAKATIKRLKSDIEVLNGEKKEWQSLYEEAVKGNQEPKEVSMNPVVEPEIIEPSSDVQEKAEALLKLEAMTFEELKELFKMQGGSLQGIKSKEQLIKKIVETEQK